LNLDDQRPEDGNVDLENDDEVIEDREDLSNKSRDTNSSEVRISSISMEGSNMTNLDVEVSEDVEENRDENLDAGNGNSLNGEFSEDGLELDFDSCYDIDDGSYGYGPLGPDSNEDVVEVFIDVVVEVVVGSGSIHITGINEIPLADSSENVVEIVIDVVVEVTIGNGSIDITDINQIPLADNSDDVVEVFIEVVVEVAIGSGSIDITDINETPSRSSEGRGEERESSDECE